MSKVTVYYFTTYDGNSDKEVRSKGMSTLERIKRIGNSSPILDTAKEVNDSDLDGNGRYCPKKSS